MARVQAWQLPAAFTSNRARTDTLDTPPFGEYQMNLPPDQDPLQFLKSLWGQMGIPFSGMVTPTLDVGELDKRIGDLKSVQNWLTLNLSMIQATIQGLEMQKATLSAIRQGMDGKPPESSTGNPMVDTWWDFIQSQMKQGAAPQGAAPQDGTQQANSRPSDSRQDKDPGIVK